MPPAGSNDPPRDPRLPQGALLNADQIRLLKRAIIVMSVILVAGVLTVLGRIAYLMTKGSGTGAAAATVATNPPLAAAAAVPLQTDVRLALPAGDQVKAATLSGHRLVIHHAGPAGETITILDVATGQVASRVKIVK